MLSQRVLGVTEQVGWGGVGDVVPGVSRLAGAHEDLVVHPSLDDQQAGCDKRLLK